MALVKTSQDGGYFAAYIRQRIRRNKNFLAAITGPTGSGKSWSAIRIAEVLDPDFDIRNLCFTGKEFLSLVNGKTKPLGKGSVIVWDEMQVAMSHQSWQSLQSRLINYVLQTFRHRNFVLLITSPHFDFINATARKLFHCTMETIGIDKETKTVKLKPLLLQPNQRSGKVYFKYLRVSHPEHGVCPIKSWRIGKPSDELLKAYEEKKAEFTTKLNEGIERDLEALEAPQKGKKELTQIQREVVEDLKAGLTVSQIAEKRSKAEQVIYEHLRLIKKKGIEIMAIKEGARVIGYEVEGYAQ